MSSVTDGSLFSQLPSTDPKSPSRVSGYDELPEAIRAVYSEKEYLWLGDQGRRSLVQRETEPECE